MRLDRNINPDRRGKYCLINLRKTQAAGVTPLVLAAMTALHQAGVLEWGHESQESQFFVMKYSDPFTADGLLGYAQAVRSFAERGVADNRMVPADVDNWMEYYNEIMSEAEAAKLCNHKTPD